MYNVTQLVQIFTAAQLFIKDKILQPVADPFLKINNFFTEQLTSAKVVGIDDGKVNLPKVNDTSIYENKSISLFRSLFNQVASQSMGHIRSLSSSLDAILQEVGQSEYVQSCLRIEDAFNNKIKIIKSKIDLLDKEIRSIKYTFDIAQAEAGRPSGQTDGIGYFIKYPLLLYAILIALGFLDLPFSVSALEQMNFDNWETRIVAIAIVVAVAVLSHFAGLYLKRYKTHSKFFWFTFIPVLMFILFASIMRYTFSNSTSSGETTSFDFNSESTSGLMERISSFDLSNAIQDPNFWFFIIMNFVILLVGILFSYYVHDSHANFEKAWRKMQVAIPSIQNQISQLESNIADEEALAKISIGQKSHLLDDNLRELVQHYEQALDSHNQIASYVNTAQEDVEDKYKVVINEYRDQNLKHRTDDAMDVWNRPISFSLERVSLRENNILRFFNK